jgi:hypothetical protein
VRLTLLALLALCACRDSGPRTQPASLEDLAFEVPAAWKHTDVVEPSRHVSRWTPNENSAKESISVIRTTLRGPVKHADTKTLTAMLADAQRSLPQGAFRTPVTIQTRTGLTAIVVDGSFTPSGQADRYRRVHALVVDGTAIVHVLYTARSAEPDLASFHLVLETLHREQG